MFPAVMCVTVFAGPSAGTVGKIPRTAQQIWQRRGPRVSVHHCMSRTSDTRLVPQPLARQLWWAAPQPAMLGSSAHKVCTLGCGINLVARGVCVTALLGRSCETRLNGITLLKRMCSPDETIVYSRDWVLPSCGYAGVSRVSIMMGCASTCWFGRSAYSGLPPRGVPGSL